MNKLEFKHLVIIAFFATIAWYFVTGKDDRTPLQRKHGIVLFEKPVHLGSHVLLDSRGNKVLLEQLNNNIAIIAFWAPWCKYCAKDFAEIDSVYNTLQENNIGIIPIVRNTEEPLKIRQFYSKLQNVPETFITGDKLLYQKIKFRGFPTFLIIDDYGRAIAKARPNWQEEDLFQMIDEVVNSNK